MKGDKDTKHMVSSTHKYSDGTETIVNYVANPEKEEIEEKVAEAVESDHTNPDGIEENKEIEEAIEAVAESEEALDETE